MTTPFDGDGPFLVLVNDRGEHSLWPTAVPVPDGWRTVLGPATRAACAAYVDEHWTALKR
ncbi:MbtH family protein [Saccharothrix sp. Mg75]|uniref:MbtH family protein n=1 Tax=Saccharothrix sp. Mg75 TaxID=3445357 RepID=UPI003EF06267